MMLDGAECYARMAFDCVFVLQLLPLSKTRPSRCLRRARKQSSLCCPPLPWLPTEREGSHSPPRLNYSRERSSSNEGTWFDTKAGMRLSSNG
jgi:hypothetical protein